MPPKVIFGAGAKFHSFGIERPYETLPAERSTSGAGAKMSLSKEVFPPAPGPPEAGDGASAGSGGLAFATTKQVPTLKESELSRQVEQVSNNMAEREESASNQLEQVTKQRDALQQQINDEYDRAGNLELQVDKLKSQLDHYKTELKNSQRVHDDTEYSLKQSEETLAEEQSTTKTLEARITKLEKDLALHEAAIKDKSKQIDNLTADCQQLSYVYEVTLRDRDEARVQLEEKSLEFEDLKDQWQTDQERIAELQEAIKEHEDSNLVAELENDIAGLNAKQEQDFRTIIIKDERISHLEAMLQKEQERNLHNADETARAAAASPVDDQRHIGSMGGTLEDEFSSLMLDENDFIEREPSEYEPELQSLSAIHVTASVAPRKAAPASPSTIVVNNAASTEPVAVKVPKHTIAVRDAASIEPLDSTPAPPSTINFSKPVSIAPEAVRVPVQTTGFYKALSTEPIEPARVALSFNDVHDIASFAPKQPAGVPFVYYNRQAASTEPIEPARAPLSIDNVRYIASYAPKQPTTALLAVHEQKPVSTEPIEPARTPLSFNDVHDIASFAPKQPAGAPLAYFNQQAVSTDPIEPARAPLSFNDVHDIASFAPEQPTPVSSTIVRHEVANFAPEEPSLPVLTVDVTEAASTRPIVRRITATELSTQTDAPAPTANLSTQTDAPTATADLSIQTDAPVVTMAEFSTQTEAPPLTSQILSHAILATIPTEPSTQTATVKPNNRIAPIIVTREIKPVEQAPPKAEAECPTTTTGAQANINKDTAEEHVMANTPPVMATSSKKAGFTGWIPMLLAVLLAVYSLFLQAELATWKNANGVGFGGGYGNVASRSGAYGNGRNLFGVIPIGMNIGNSWMSEQIARRMSVAISLIEDWAGIVNEPMY